MCEALVVGGRREAARGRGGLSCNPALWLLFHRGACPGECLGSCRSGHRSGVPLVEAQVSCAHPGPHSQGELGAVGHRGQWEHGAQEHLEDAPCGLLEGKPEQLLSPVQKFLSGSPESLVAERWDKTSPEQLGQWQRVFPSPSLEAATPHSSSQRRRCWGSLCHAPTVGVRCWGSRAVNGGAAGSLWGSEIAAAPLWWCSGTWGQPKHRVSGG